MYMHIYSAFNIPDKFVWDMYNFGWDILDLNLSRFKLLWNWAFGQLLNVAWQGESAWLLIHGCLSGVSSNPIQGLIVKKHYPPWSVVVLVPGTNYSLGFFNKGIICFTIELK